MTDSRVQTPGSIEEFQDALSLMQVGSESVLACGGRSRFRRHAPDAAPDLWLSTASLNAVRWLDTEDQTCEVEAGMSPAELQQLLGPEGLELGILAPNAEAGTLGGLFMGPDISLLHGSYGPPRDQVLGAEWLLANGKRIRTGARVVKSVAGYDLTRLLLGSRGQLAICTSLTLRLRPKPRTTSWHRCVDPVAWRAALGPVPRFAVQAQPTEALYLQYIDGDTPPADTATDCEPAYGEDALRRSLQGYSEAPRRIALTHPRTDIEHCGADWNTLQFATATALPLPTGAGQIPMAEESSWLEQLAHACAPGARRFGVRG